MVKTLARGRQYMTDAYWSAVGFASAAMLSIHPVFATGTGTSTIWNRFSTILQDIYGQVVAISTIVAVTVGAIALLIRMISRNQRAVDEATHWLESWAPWLSHFHIHNNDGTMDRHAPLNEGTIDMATFYAEHRSLAPMPPTPLSCRRPGPPWTGSGKRE